MGTQLILTVGTNPLPVWVAWYHLKDLKDKLPQPIKVRLVHTAGTKDEMERLKKYCQGAKFLDPIQTSAGDPGTVRGDSRNILRNLSEDVSHLHVHYTGGTKVMGVETVSTIEAELREGQNIHLQTSYLDPRGKSGPTIVSRGAPLVSDTRRNVNLDLNCIALLNGFTLGPFNHRYRDRETRSFKTENCPAPATPSQEQLDAGVAVLAVARDNEKFRELSSNRSKWNEFFSSQYGKFSYPQQGGTFRFSDNPIWQNKLLPALNKVYSYCKWDINAGTLSYPSYQNACDNQQRELEQVHKFFNGIWLEYGAYAAFKDALKKNSNSSNPKLKRDNYKLFHSVHARRAKATDQRVKPFELDVVAVLGYQIVVVSCTVDSVHDRIKQKGMEAILRARQLGGDEARAIVLCSAHLNDATLIEDELKDEMGSTSEPLQVWGRNRWRELSKAFLQYLSNDLHWK